VWRSRPLTVRARDWETSTMLGKIRSVALALALCLVPAVVMAQGTPATPAPPPSVPVETPAASPLPAEGRSGRLAACREDVERLCPAAAGGARLGCMRENVEKLTPACATAFKEIESLAKAMREACAEDVKLFCSTERNSKGGSTIVPCLRTNETKLAPACVKALDARFPKS
jgi:hypothetical protein